MRFGLALAFITGCGAKAAQPTVTNEAQTERKVWNPSIVPFEASAPRPELPVEQLIPDFHEELRWPLSAMSHPELEPQFEIATVFAQPGVGWIELCERGVQNRITAGRNRDELEYLRGWCSAIKGDADQACGKLAPLTSSPVLGMPAAVRVDVANIIANAGDIDAADKLINKHRIRDFEIYDTLAATYVELGKEPDAYEMNRRVLDDVSANARDSDFCRRLVRDIVLGGKSGRELRISQLSDMATKPKLPDETCERLDREVRCWVGPANACFEYFTAENIDPRNTFLLEAYQAWPTRGTYKRWLDVVQVASLAGDLPGARELVDIALDTAVRVAPACVRRLMEAIASYQRIYGSTRLQAELDRCKYVEAAPPSSPGSSADVAADTVSGSELDVALVGRALSGVALLAHAIVDEIAERIRLVDCDADVAKDKAFDHVNRGQHAFALAWFEVALRCKDDPHLRQFAFAEACASGNAPKAKLYYKLLTPAQQTKLAQVCIRQNPPVDYQ